MSIDDSLPEDNTAYKTKAYWDARYSKYAQHSLVGDDGRETEKTFDWFKDYAPLKEIFNGSIPDRDSSILMLGCGNSGID